MGFSELTRYELFRNASMELMKLEQIRFKDIKAVSSMYQNSATVLEGVEEIINNDSYISAEELEYHLRMNMNQLEDYEVVNQLRQILEKRLTEKSGKKAEVTAKDIFRLILKAIADYQDKIIKENHILMEDYDRVSENRPQTFLSYAYYDKGLSLALFIYFWNRGGFLYVNWMWEKANTLGIKTKIKLEKALSDSQQLLFLRTTNSELHTKGNNSIRQWCSWEIGNFYTKRETEKYYTSFYDKEIPRNDLLDSFKPMKMVDNGRII